MLYQIKTLYKEYPSQYWLMILGVVLATAGGSMIWPFLLIYVSGKLNLPLSQVAALISINAGMGLASSVIAGWLADHIGRKLVMNASLVMTGLGYLLMLRAETYPHFVWLMILIGLSNPLYQVGADAMLADMIPSEKRTDAYAINRIANNSAFALGPAVGGFLAGRSYDLAFYGAAAGFLSYAILLFFLARETLVKHLPTADKPQEHNSSPRGFVHVIRDGGFMAFVFSVAIGLIAPLMVWILMPVYAKTNFGVAESQYGWIPTTNALMCVFVQYLVTRAARKYNALPVSAVGMLIYAVGAGSVALMSSFWGFWTSMVILTFGELTLIPVASKYVADRAPEDLRGRYMSVHWLAWGVARTVAPLLGGYLNDAFFPQAIWIGGLALGLLSALSLAFLSRREVRNGAASI